MSLEKKNTVVISHALIMFLFSIFVWRLPGAGELSRLNEIAGIVLIITGIAIHTTYMIVWHKDPKKSDYLMWGYRSKYGAFMVLADLMFISSMLVKLLDHLNILP